MELMMREKLLFYFYVLVEGELGHNSPEVQWKLKLWL